MPNGRRLASYRPTVRQLLGRTVLIGVGVGLAATALVLAIAFSGVRSPWIYLVFLPLAAVGGFVVLSELGRHGGVDATEHGLVRVAARAAATRYVPWGKIAEIRTERRGWRTVVVVSLVSGTLWRLRAPYDGRWFSHDPDFEPKLFNLRNLWETHRTWAAEFSPRPTGFRPAVPGGTSPEEPAGESDN
ncbi:MAG: hypothetical protein ACRDT6_20475 [Micromonosporaceae bacterium]